MSAPAKPRLRPGKVYRTRDLARWGQNPTRLARRLTRDGELVELRHGLFYRPKKSQYGPVPPTDRELMRAFLDGEPFVFTGPRFWNALGLGSTAVFADQMVYNTKQSGVFQFGNRKFVLRRVRFPKKPTPEWYAVDLIENHEKVGVDPSDLEAKLKRAVATERLNGGRLTRASDRFGIRRTQALVARAVQACGSV